MAENNNHFQWFLLAFTGALAAGLVHALNISVPSFTVLALSTDFDTSYNENNKIGKKYGWYLVDPYGTLKGSSENNINRDWWEMSYKTWKTDFENKVELSDEFKDESKVKFAFASKVYTDVDAGLALNRVCEGVYKKELTEVDWEDKSNNKYKLGRDLLKYCSPLGQKPLDIDETKDTTYPKGTFAETYKINLISSSNSKNDIFWKLRNESFFSRDNVSSEIQDNEEDPFKILFSKKNGNIKDECSKTYLLQTIKTNLEGSRISKFCSWTDSEAI